MQQILLIVIAVVGTLFSLPLLAGEINLSAPPVILNKTAAIGPAELAVIINREDPLSVRIGAYYQKQRAIPQQNMVYIAFKPGRDVISKEEFATLKADVEAQTATSIQAYALTWVAPFRVDCMSITTAFAAGFDLDYCAQGCKLTKTSPYFNSSSKNPYKDFGIRPTMSIAAVDFNSAKALIDRGIASDTTFPTGTAYLLHTSDKHRTVRVNVERKLQERVTQQVKLKILKQDYLTNRDDILFYFTGLTKVPKIETNHYLPGAIADHLTSAGGILTGSGQMSSLRWLEAGATGSYGTVVEPCNFPGKFPVPEITMAHYLSGESLIESYWKSVAMPGQGVFIGEPLAKPFGGFHTTAKGNRLTIYSPVLSSGEYQLYGANTPKGPFTLAAAARTLTPSPYQLQFRVNKPYSFYLLKKV